MSFRGRARRRQQTDPMARVRGVTTDLAERLAEVNGHLEAFASALSEMASVAKSAHEAARGAGEGDE